MAKHLGEFEQLLLFAVLGLRGDAYGVTIRQAIERRTGRELSAGAVYTALERLERRGFLSSEVGGATPERGGRRKRYYRLEPAGAAALRRSYGNLRRMAEGLESRLDELAPEPEPGG